MLFKTANQKIASVLLIVSIVFLYYSFKLPKFPYVNVDSDVVPKLLGFLLFALSIALYFNKTDEAAKEKHSPADLRVLLSVLGMALLYILLLEAVGFVIVNALFLIVCTKFLGYKNWKVNISVSLIYSLAIYFSFNYLLDIELPAGILPL
ncbi:MULTISPECIES: tripartite tricarboxylate transporter TctB family protein [Paenibacillus]|uniref:Tripartite tricarboxylate transporter family receptor n=1 Tax=Paenibacillus naphthalenovorans TaxID=162209 RepID=A0A0U2MWS4_9BACL|nr:MULTISPECIES: tripartite tricarboxylate transporter TctB family protein [Paenibacillus]ALS22415.1 tripartite tricarboxylate transporter family receptor [Paenibacillus naphthalenovorans]GCL70202.1 tripartite tricarboxylate transporter TctB family protein [Paenibacillus naphthalenovorans]SDH89017.1 putative tricarboxylic transport membrane protein [Paenibacillus naphthalenovorans]